MQEKPRLSDRIRSTARLKHFSLRTENSYLNWIKRYYLFHNRKDPALLCVENIRNFLSHLASDKHVSASTQNQALCALLFLYKDVLQIPIPKIENIERAKTKQRIPVVFSQQEVKAILSKMNGTNRLIASLLYGSGLRLMECVRLVEYVFCCKTQGRRDAGATKYKLCIERFVTVVSGSAHSLCVSYDRSTHS